LLWTICLDVQTGALKMAAPQPDFIAIGEAYQTLSNEMPRLANLDAAQVQQQILNALNLLVAEYVPGPNSHTQ
jgi:hypothetical protein